MIIKNEQLLLELCEEIVCSLRDRIWEIENSTYLMNIDLTDEHEKFLTYNSNQLKRKIVRVKQFRDGIHELKDEKFQTPLDIKKVNQSDQDWLNWINQTINDVEDHLIIVKFAQKSAYEKIIFVIPALENAFQLALTPLMQKYFWLQTQLARTIHAGR